MKRHILGIPGPASSGSTSTASLITEAGGSMARNESKKSGSGFDQGAMPQCERHEEEKPAFFII
jgi:hypothetical protein